MVERTIYFSFGYKKGKGDNFSAFLSNFFPSPFVKDGITYQTVEHYFQSEKYDDPELKAIIINAESPALAKRAGRAYDIDVDSWNNRRDQVMMEALELKFSQNEVLKRKLIGTGNAKLVEDSRSDKYWGGTAHGSKSALGIMLMNLRWRYRCHDTLNSAF